MFRRLAKHGRRQYRSIHRHLNRCRIGQLEVVHSPFDGEAFDWGREIPGGGYRGNHPLLNNETHAAFTDLQYIQAWSKPLHIQRHKPLHRISWRYGHFHNHSPGYPPKHGSFTDIIRFNSTQGQLV